MTLVEKVILPEDPHYAAHERVIHSPAVNRITADDPVSVEPIATYAKRPKLYASFEKFAYQQHQLEHAIGTYDMCCREDARNASGLRLIELTRHFLTTVLR